MIGKNKWKEERERERKTLYVWKYHSQCDLSVFFYLSLSLSIYMNIIIIILIDRNGLTFDLVQIFSVALLSDVDSVSFVIELCVSFNLSLWLLFLLLLIYILFTPHIFLSIILFYLVCQTVLFGADKKSHAAVRDGFCARACQRCSEVVNQNTFVSI